MSFSVRPTTLADADTVTALLERCYPPVLAPHYDPGLLSRALRWLTEAQPTLLESDSFYVAVDDDRGGIVGCGGWTAARPGSGALEPGLGHLRHFATDPAFARRGIGRALVERCLAEARAAGLTRFECYSTFPAEPFYAAFGFERVAQVEIPLPEDLLFPAVLMRRPADTAS